MIPAIAGLMRRYGMVIWYYDAEDPEAVARLGAALRHDGAQR